MKQYLDLLKEIKEKGTHKSAAREGMPGTLSLFGAQMRFDLSKGFPILTTKKVSFKNIVTELLWFLKGDTNIKYLVDNGCNIWNEDAYNYYLKKLGKGDKYTFEGFILAVKGNIDTLPHLLPKNYKLGDCGKQYGWLWRRWSKYVDDYGGTFTSGLVEQPIDQIKDLIEGLKKNPMGRRHIITAWNPATLDDMALNACHAFVQFNCRKITPLRRCQIAQSDGVFLTKGQQSSEFWDKECDSLNIPKYYLDCQMYQRSADVFLGVPYNIASYALLTEIFAKICNMIPGDFIHTFGDVHIYDNHLDAVEEQLKRTPEKLPTLKMAEDIQWNEISNYDFTEFMISDFELEGYNPQSSIKAKLSTGLK